MVSFSVYQWSFFCLVGCLFVFLVGFSWGFELGGLGGRVL